MFTVHKILDNSSYKMGWREATMDFTVGRGILAGLDNTQNKSVHKLKKKNILGEFSSPKHFDLMSNRVPSLWKTITFKMSNGFHYFGSI